MWLIGWINEGRFQSHFISKFTKRANEHCEIFFAFVGGWIGSEIGKTMERYDPEENKWEIIGSMAVPRYYFGCCELQGLFL